MSFINPSQREVVAFVVSLCFAIAATGVCVAFGEAPVHPGAIENVSLEASQDAAVAPVGEGAGS